MGDRRDFFEKVTRDPWDNFRQVLDERKKREIDPTLAVLRECVAEAEKSGAAEKETRQRLGELLDFFQSTTGWYEQMRRLPNAALVKFMKLGARVQKLLGLG
jgi:DNA-binding transcriptional regulator GbsR (MarR family)